MDWLPSAIAAIGAAAGAWAAVRVELKYMGRDIETLQVKVDRMSRELHAIRSR